jgi:hypothetical protein
LARQLNLGTSTREISAASSEASTPLGFDQNQRMLAEQEEVDFGLLTASIDGLQNGVKPGQPLAAHGVAPIVGSEPLVPQLQVRAP